MRGIYAITNIISDTVYYGQSLQMKSRLNQHKRALKKNIHDNPRLQHSYNKHGESAFIFTPIYIIEEKQTELTPIEKRCIEETYSLGLKVFNIRKPDIHALLSEDTKKKMSESKKGEKNYNYGRIFSDETRKKLREAQKGKTHSDETKKKISLLQKGKIVSEENRKKLGAKKKGKSHSEETKHKISEAHKGKALSEEHKKKIGEGQKGRVHSAETKQRRSDSMKKYRSLKKHKDL